MLRDFFLGEAQVEPYTAAALRLENQANAILERLPGTDDKKRFRTINQTLWQMAIGVAIGTVGWTESNESLRKRWEQTEDTRALGAVRGAIEEVHGPIEDIANIPEAWIRRGLSTAARRNLNIPTKGSGKHTMSLEKQEGIIADCEKWLSICKGLNTDFKRLRKDDSYLNSASYRKEARGKLADKFSIPVKDVQAIEWSLFKKPPRRGREKSTPTEAMCRIVARNHFGVGHKRVEQIWFAYRRKTATNQTAGRTASY